MGKNTVINPKQKLILEEIKKEPRLAGFYFTGGTALSAFYLQHRESIDLDFFAQKTFDPQMVTEVIIGWSKKYNFTVRTQYIDPTYNYFLEFPDGDRLKIDFAHYPYFQLEPPKVFDGLSVDSFYDLSVNKFLTINQRTEVKDFVDVYFVYQSSNFWQLKDGVMAKFNIEIDPYLMAVDYMKVEEFENMPKMLKPLKLTTLKEFFREQAKKLGGEMIK